MPPRKRQDKQRRALGSVYQRADGQWAAMLDLGIVGGKRKRVVRYGSSEKEAEKRLADLIAESGRGALQAPSTTTVAEWLDGYLARQHKTRDSRPATIREDRRLVGLITAQLGTRRLTALHGAHVQGMMQELGRYSARTRRKLLQKLNAALDEAVALDLLARNPAKAVTLPRLPVPDMKHKAWSKQEAERFLRAVRGHRLFALYRLMLGQGLRLGETIPLKLEHYDREKGTLFIRDNLQREDWTQTRRTGVGPTKTAASTRLLTLPADLRAELEAHLARRETDASRAAAAGVWQEQGWMFPSEVGTMLGDRNVSRHLDTVIANLNAAATRAAAEESKRSGRTVRPELLRRLTPHGFRYTFINLAIRAGVSFDVVAAVVGHSSPVITMRIYRQVQQEEIQESGAKLEGLFSLE